MKEGSFGSAFVLGAFQRRSDRTVLDTGLGAPAVLVLGFALLLRRALRTRAASTPPSGAAEPPSIPVPRRGEPT
ncbi:MAG: hypothetical protein ACRDTE_31000 [Pseudonocardiaceae bacterium]